MTRKSYPVPNPPEGEGHPPCPAPILAWLDARRAVADALSRADSALDAAGRVDMPPMHRLRHAEPRDIVQGNILWYPEHRRDCDNAPGCWHYIEEVDYPNSAYKAYSAEDGCRYGLDGAYVEVV